MAWIVKEALHHFTLRILHLLYSTLSSREEYWTHFPIFLTFNRIFVDVWMTWWHCMHGNLTSGARAVKRKPTWKQLSSDFQCQIIFISTSSWMVSIRNRSVYEMMEENQKGKVSHLFFVSRLHSHPKKPLTICMDKYSSEFSTAWMTDLGMRISELFSSKSQALCSFPNTYTATHTHTTSPPPHTPRHGIGDKTDSPFVQNTIIVCRNLW